LLSTIDDFSPPLTTDIWRDGVLFRQCKALAADNGQDCDGEKGGQDHDDWATSAICVVFLGAIAVKS